MQSPLDALSPPLFFHLSLVHQEPPRLSTCSWKAPGEVYMQPFDAFAGQ